jgi:hypothetical protein
MDRGWNEQGDRWKVGERSTFAMMEGEDFGFTLEYWLVRRRIFDIKVIPTERQSFLLQLQSNRLIVHRERRNHADRNLANFV